MNVSNTIMEEFRQHVHHSGVQSVTHMYIHRTRLMYCSHSCFGLIFFLLVEPVHPIDTGLYFVCPFNTRTCFPRTWFLSNSFYLYLIDIIQYINCSHSLMGGQLNLLYGKFNLLHHHVNTCHLLYQVLVEKSVMFLLIHDHEQFKN